MSVVVFFEDQDQTRRVLCFADGEPIRFNALMGYIEWFDDHLEYFDFAFTTTIIARLHSGGLGAFGDPDEDPMITLDRRTWRSCCLKPGRRVPWHLLAGDTKWSAKLHTASALIFIGWGICRLLKPSNLRKLRTFFPDRRPTTL